MRGLDPRIHHLAMKMDCRVKPGNDDGEAVNPQVRRVGKGTLSASGPCQPHRLSAVPTIIMSDAAIAMVGTALRARS